MDERHLIEEQRRYAMLEQLHLYTYEERQAMKLRMVREILDREVLLWGLYEIDKHE